MRFLQSIDVYRRIPNDLTTGSSLGGISTIIAFALISVVVIVEIMSFTSIEHDSHVELDHDLENGVYLNFNVTLDEITCDFLQVDIIDIFAQKPRQVPSGSVIKMGQEGFFKGTGIQSAWLDPELQAKESRSKLPSYLIPDPPAKSEVRVDTAQLAENQRQISAGKMLVKEIEEEGLSEELTSADIVFVQYYAPWSIKSKKLTPQFQQAAYQTSQKTDGIRFIRYDCSSSRRRMDVCVEQGVIGFPSVYIYSKYEKLQAFDNALHVYDGQTTAEAISTYAYYLKMFAGGKSEKELEDLYADVEATRASSKFHSRGCRIEGSVPMNKVPTEVLIRAVSDYHNVNSSLYTVSHSLHHLSVGRMLPEFRMVTSAQRKNPEKIMERNKKFNEKVKEIRDKISFAYFNTYGPRAQKRVETGKMHSIKNKGGKDFKSRGPLAYDHYVRVVPVSLFPKHQAELNDFDYTLTTDSYTVDYGTAPKLTLKVEISPMRLVLEERYKSFSSTFLNLMSLVGGIYSSMMIFQAALHTTFRLVIKKND